jgi:serine/threonine protein kinase
MRDAPIMAPPRSTAQTDCLNQGGDNEQAQALRQPQRPMTLSAGSRLGPYEIQSLIGAGGMGEVYRARDTRLDRDVALKVLHADVAANPVRLERFQREAKTVASLNHPQIVTLYSVEPRSRSSRRSPSRCSA